MKNLAIILGVLCFSIQLIAQPVIKEIVKEGIQYHDSGKYEKAIETYKKGLKISPKSAILHYELALSYFSHGNYKKAIKHANKVLKQKGDYMLEAYMTKGSALDVLGKTKQSIKLFEKAIEETGGHYLLYYNLALNYYNTGKLAEAERNAIKAISLNPNHSSSHLMLANIHNQKGNTVQTLLATHYFLLLEPNSQRSAGAFQMLQERFGGNVTTDENKPNTINVLLSGGELSEFSTAELMVSMFAVSAMADENKGKTADEMFVENTTSFFSTMGELKKGKSDNIWWTFYTSFFYNLSQSEHIETYCKYISQSEKSKIWLSENENKLNDFADWLKEN